MKLSCLLFLVSWLALCEYAMPVMAKDQRALEPQLRVADGNIDRQVELQRLFDLAAQTGQPVFLPAGHYQHSGLLYLRGIDVSGAGATTVIEGTTRDQAALILTGKNARLSNLVLTFQSTTRSSNSKSADVLVQGADHFEVGNVKIDGGDSVGIFMDDSHHGLIHDNDIRSTLADSMHMTNGSSDIILHDNTTHDSGDDGIAVVSYERNGKKVHNIEAFHNSIIDNKFARGMSVVGGDAVYYHDNIIKCTGKWAGIYIASESVFKTYGASNVRVTNTKMENCGGHDLGQGAVTVFSDYNENHDIVFENNTLEDSPWIGFHIIGKANTGIVLKDNVIQRVKGEPVYEEPQTPPIEQSGTKILGAY